LRGRSAEQPEPYQERAAASTVNLLAGDRATVANLRTVNRRRTIVDPVGIDAIAPGVGPGSRGALRHSVAA
jgi:hypothetical protein